jgi:hypothetical protein
VAVAVDPPVADNWRSMRLFDSAGHGVDLRVVGYQFPEPEDPMHFSWHMIEGTAVSPQGTWTFRAAGLGCDESPRLSAWLRAAADFTPADQSASRLESPFFKEPNVKFALGGCTGETIVLEIGFDMKFAPPWRPQRYTGDAFVIAVESTREQVRLAARDWDVEIATYPPGTKYTGPRLRLPPGH